VGSSLMSCVRSGALPFGGSVLPAVCNSWLQR